MKCAARGKQKIGNIPTLPPCDKALLEFQVPEDVCLEELEDSQCLSDDTDTEAASEVGKAHFLLGVPKKKKKSG